MGTEKTSDLSSLMREEIRRNTEDFFESEKEIILEEVKKSRQSPLDFLNRAYQLGYQRVGIGESHSDAKTHHFMAELVQRLPQINIRTVALEINQPEQDSFDQFQEGKIDEKELRFRLERNPFQGSGKKRWQTDDYFKIIENARNSGVKIIAFDDKRKGESMSSSKRDQRMCQNLLKITQPHLIYVGALHLSKGWDGCGTLLKEQGGEKAVSAIKHLNFDSPNGFTEDYFAKVLKSEGCEPYIIEWVENQRLKKLLTADKRKYSEGAGAYLLDYDGILCLP